MPKQPYSRLTYTPRTSVGHLIRHAAKLVTQGVESQFAEAEVSFIQWAVLVHLRDGMATTAAGLCQSIVHDSGALTRVIDQLEQRGLLARNRSQVDRRQVELELTKEGRQTVEKLVPAVVDYYNAVLTDFTLEEVATLVTLLDKLNVSLATSLER